MWKTKAMANSQAYLLALYCSDGSVTGGDTSGVFEVFNERGIIPAGGLDHVHGNGSATIMAQIVDPDQLTGDLYRVTFNDTLFANTVYDVLNVDTGKKVIENATELDGISEGPYFDGLRLLIKDLKQAEIDAEGTGWTTGSSSLQISITVPNIDIGTKVLEGVPFPADYRITIFDQVVDTSRAVYGAAAVPMMFMVWDLTAGARVDAIFLDTDNNHTISRLDELFLLLPDGDEPQLTWAFFFGGSPSAVNPRPGDEFILRTLKPLTGDDVYEFRASEHVQTCTFPGDANQDGSLNVLDVVSVINFILGSNPEPFNMMCADCDGDSIVNVIDVVGIVNVILGIGECVPGVSKVSVLPQTMEFLGSLQDYLSAPDYTRFMDLVRATLFPAEYHLAQNCPNPFNPTTDIRYQISDTRYPIHTTLEIFNILGQEVRTLVDEMKEPGHYTVTWDGRNEQGILVAGGVYIYRLEAGGTSRDSREKFSDTKRMILLK
jgi:hypothetical protein